MSITIHANTDEAGKFSIDGELTIYEAAACKDDLLSRLDSYDAIDFDLSGVQEIDGAGMQLLLLAKREASESGKQLSFSNHSQAVLDAFDLCGLFQTFGDQVVYVVKDKQ